MARLKELHKNDKQELQKAMMKLYKTEGINPASGCFPILVQIPIFFSLYKLLLLDISMRHAPFIWIWEDLSTKDPLTIFKNDCMNEKIFNDKDFEKIENDILNQINKDAEWAEKQDNPIADDALKNIYANENNFL